MRIRRLDLARYGRFTDLSLDFGEASTDPDLHLVYGPNEAGKSTVFTAFLELMYGIHPQSPYNFLHPHPTMRIGAALEIAGTTREFVRIKRPSNSLLDAEGRPIAESTIQAELGGVGREAYRSMFSLDDDSLEAGGKAILDSRGDLGELLFSATSGLAELRRSLDDVVAKADKYYRYRASQGELLTLKARLADLKTQREAIDTAAGTYRKLLETRDRDTEAYDSAVKGRGLSQARLDRVVASLGALPRLAALHDMHARLEALRALPQAPEGWIEDVPVLQSETVRLGTLTQTVAGEIERLEAEIAKIAPDEASLRLADRMELLAASRARAFTAKKDLPERHLSLRAIDATVDGIVARLDRAKEDDTSRLVLSTAEVGTLQALIEARSGIDAALTSAVDEHATAIRRLAEARAKVAEIVEEPGVGSSRTPAPLPVLSRALKTARSSDHATRARSAERIAMKTSRAVADGLGGLHPFKGGLDDLVRSEVPANEVLDGWRDRIAGLTTKHAQLVDAHTTCEREIAQLEAEGEAITRAEGPVPEGQAAALRTARERAWAHHRSRLDADSADAFEDAMRRDDASGDRRLSDMADREKLRQIEKAVAAAQFDRASALSQLDAIAEERGSIDAEMAAAWGRATGDTAAPGAPREFARWIERRDDVLKVRQELLDAQADLTEAVDDQTRAMRDLREALSESSIPFAADDGFEKLIGIGQEAADADMRLSGLRSKEAECARELADRAAALATASSKEEAWARDWRQACAACWLGDAGAAPGLAAVREALAALSPLGAALQNRTALNDRISKMERDLGAFASETSVFAGEIDEPVGGDAFEVAGRVASRVTAAVDASRRREKLIADLDAARKRQRDLAEQTVVTARRVEEMTARYDVADLVAVFERLKDAGAAVDPRERGPRDGARNQRSDGRRGNRGCEASTRGGRPGLPSKGSAASSGSGWRTRTSAVTNSSPCLRQPPKRSQRSAQTRRSP